MNTSIPVKAIMCSQPVSVSVDASWKSINTIFEQDQLRHLLVLDQEERLVGIISRTDRLLKLKQLLNQTSGKTWTNKEEKATKAKDLMTTSPVSLHPDDSIGQAAELMLSHEFNAIPIERDGIVIGLLSAADLIKYAFASSLKKEIA